MNDALEATRSAFYAKIVEVLKLLLTGRVVENASNRGKTLRGEEVMKQVVGEVVRNGSKSACFAVFEWAYANHLNELLFSVGLVPRPEA